MRTRRAALNIGFTLVIRGLTPHRGEVKWSSYYFVAPTIS